MRFSAALLTLALLAACRSGDRQGPTTDAATAGPAGSQPAAEPTETGGAAVALVMRAMQVNGLERKLEPIPQLVRGTAESMLGVDPDLDKPRVVEIVEATATLEALRKAAHGHLRTRADPAQLRLAADFGSSPLGTKITALTSTAFDLEPDVLMRRVRAVPDNPDFKLRRARFEALVQASGSQEHIIENAVTVFEALLRGMQRGRHTGDRLPEQELAESVRSYRARFQGQETGTLILCSTFLRYGSLSDPELQAYADFLSSPLGTWLQDETNRAIRVALQSVVEQLGEQLVLGLAPTAPRAAQAGERKYPDLGFAVWIDGEPEQDQETLKRDKGQLTKLTAHLGRDGAYFVVTAIQHPAPPKDLAERARWLDQMRDGVLRNLAGARLAEEAVTLGAHSGRSFGLEHDGVILRGRLFVVGKRTYQIYVAHHFWVSAARVDRFLDSLKLLEE